MISLLRTAKSSVIDIYQFIGPAAKADLLRMLQGMDAVKGFHAVIARRFFFISYKFLPS